MPPRIPWRSLLPGLIALTVVLLIAVGVLLFAGIGRIRGEKIHLYVVTDQARGVMRGTEVWIAGQKVGMVEGVGFRAPSADTTGRVVIAVAVRKSDAEQIRRDSPTQVRAGTNIIGPVVVSLSAGSPNSPAVRDGDTLRARAQSDFEVASVKLNAATENLGPLMADARTVLARVRDRNGTVGAVLTEGFGGDVARLRAQVNRLRARATNGGKPSGVSELMTRSRLALARVDSVRALVGSTNSSFGRFRRDSTLGTTVASLRDELTRLRASLADNEGSLGRLTTDSALSRSVTDAQREMTRLFGDMRRRPMRYVHF